jgi:hypothetical protein
VSLQNRVSPFGELFASPARGTMFGNRGGKFHRNDKTLGSKHFASRQWICCVLQFKNRQRDVWGRFYTELFFLDEVTALAAGHRPCFECRREDAKAFAVAFAQGQGLASPLRAPEMDRILHAERLKGHDKLLHRASVDDLPDGAFVALPYAEGWRDVFVIRGNELLRWTPFGYDQSILRPGNVVMDMLTPPSIVAALAAGYRPDWHLSAGLVPAGQTATTPR